MYKPQGPGIYNMGLFEAKMRPARNKLASMGGIMASSPELMQAASPPPMKPPMKPPMMPPMMPPSPPPMMPPSPPPMMPSNPMSMTQTPAQPPVKMSLGGLATAARTLTSPSVQQKAFGAARQLGLAQNMSAFLDKVMGDADERVKKAAANELTDKLKGINSATTEEEKINKTASLLGTNNTKEDIAKTMGGILGGDVSNLNIDQLNNMMMKVLVNTSIADKGSVAEKFGKSLLAGLGLARSTAAARATPSTKTNTYTPERLRQAILEKLTPEQLRELAIINEDGSVNTSKLETYVKTMLQAGLGANVQEPSTSTNINLTKDQQALVDMAKKEIEAGRDPDKIREILIEKGVPAGVV